MKKMVIVWVFLAFSLFGTLLFVGISFNNKYKPYHDLEADMRESASIYILVNKIKINNTNEFRIESSDLLKSNSIDSMTVLDDECIGYVIVTKGASENKYSPYIKCENYKTLDYVE